MELQKKTIDKNFSQLSFNSRLMFKEMKKRGIRLKRLRKTHIVRAKYERHVETFYDIYSNQVSYTKGLMIDDKYYAKRYLSLHGFPVNRGRVFKAKNVKEAQRYAKEIGFPVVLKPAMSSHGDNVYMDIGSRKELSLTIKNFTSQYLGDPYYLIEKQYSGEEYRLFINKNGFFAAVHRIPANIVGDGKHTIAQLVKKENFRRMHPRNTCLCKILLDDEAAKFLKNQSLSDDYVPKTGQIVQLRRNSNVSTGGNCYDVTDKVHPSYISFAKRVLKTLDAPFIGIDLMCKDISKKSNDYVICELNSAPGLSLHMMPEKGILRNVAGAIVDVIFPETIK